MIMCRRPLIVPMPVTTPAAGAAPLAIHSPGGPQAQFEQRRIRIDQLFDPLARSQSLFFMLAIDRGLAAAETNVGFLLGQLGDEFDQGSFYVTGHERTNRIRGLRCHSDPQFGNAIIVSFTVEVYSAALQRRNEGGIHRSMAAGTEDNQNPPSTAWVEYSGR